MFLIRSCRSPLTGFLLLALLVWPLSAQTPKRRVGYLTYQDAQPVIAALDEILPPDLKAKSSDELASFWPGWIARRDAEIRNRLAQGDEDSLVNFLLFGTSYTKQPRVTPQQVAHLEQAGKMAPASTSPEAPQLSRVLQARIDDLVRALAAPGKNERLLFARRFLVERKNYRLNNQASRAQLKADLVAALARVLDEGGSYAKTLEAARLLGNPSEELAARSTLYRTRGLSSDTSLLPNFAIEQSLEALKTRNLLAAGSTRRVAIIGPGLDFTDKQEGYDFYPQQTIQPFAVIDPLLRLGLARPDTLQVTTFDLSPRVNDHITRARQRAQRRQSYTVQLLRSPQAQWKPEAVQYWERFGEQIGKPAPPLAVSTNAGELKLRAVRIRPDIVSRIAPVDTNIVLQHLDLPPAERFDLIVATNIFVYYDIFEQSLALLNVARMLRPGGLLLSNNALLELPFSRMRSVGYLTTAYSDRPDDGDHIVWYQRLPDQ